jgi:hypothetical protein
MSMLSDENRIKDALREEVAQLRGLLQRVLETAPHFDWCASGLSAGGDPRGCDCELQPLWAEITEVLEEYGTADD